MQTSELTIAHLAKAANIDEASLWYYARREACRFKPRRKKMVKGKVREIEAPQREFKRTARGIHRFIQHEFPPHANVHGGARGRSCVSGARRHLGRKFLVWRDVKNCYPSIQPDYLQAALLNLGFRHDVAKLLTLLMTVGGRVPHGSPISSDALNLYFHRVDSRIASFCKRRGVSFTRTYDDIYASTNDWNLAREVGSFIDHELQRIKLEVNKHKRRKHGLQPRHRPQLVHNLTVNRSSGVAMPRRQKYAATAQAESLVRGAHAVSPDSIYPLAVKRRRIAGMMHYCRQLDYAPAKHLRRLLRQTDQVVLNKLSSLGITAYKKKWWLLPSGRQPNGQPNGRNEPARLAVIWRKQQYRPA